MTITSRTPGTHTALTTTNLLTLASSVAGTDAGWQSDGINTSAETDLQLIFKFRLGAGTITANTRLELWCSPGYDDGSAITYTSGLSGTQGTFTPATTGVKEQMILLHAFRISAATASVTHAKVFPSLVAYLGAMPDRLALFAAHNAGSALSSTSGDFLVAYRSVDYTGT
jgi:hypothetical protein